MDSSADRGAVIWCIDLDAPGSAQAAFFRLLSSDEQARAQKFARLVDQTRFTIARGVLRVLLARYLKQSEPQALVFDYNQAGKPALRDSAVPLHFNISHSGSLALYAFSSRAEVGIDIEEIKEIPDYLQIAERFFSAEEAIQLGSCPPEDRLKAFYRIWTTKEAYVKALGGGLSIPLASFEAKLSAGRGASIAVVDDNVKESAPWSIVEIAPRTGYIGAVAIRQSGCEVELRPCLSASAVLGLSDVG